MQVAGGAAIRAVGFQQQLWRTRRVPFDWLECTSTATSSFAGLRRDIVVFYGGWVECTHVLFVKIVFLHPRDTQLSNACS